MRWRVQTKREMRVSGTNVCLCTCMCLCVYVGRIRVHKMRGMLLGNPRQLRELEMGKKGGGQQPDLL